MTTTSDTAGARIRAVTLDMERRHLARIESALDDDCATGACLHNLQCSGARRTIAATRQRVEDINAGAAFATVLTGTAAESAGVTEGAWSVSAADVAECIGRSSAA